jgi:cytoskeletal protein CcmA (bactofilin family)
VVIKAKNNKQIYLAAGVTLNGLVKSPDSIYIAGTVKGDIRSDVAIHILKGAAIQADLHAPNIQIFGIVEGQVSASGELVMNATARVYGDIFCKSLVLEEGAIYSGALHIQREETSADTVPLE